MDHLNLYMRLGRYDELGGIPADALKHLAKMQGLIRNVARDRALHDEPGRVNAPADLLDDAIVVLAGVVPGGSVSQSWTVELLPDSVHIDTYAAAMRDLGQIFEATSGRGPYPEHTSRATLQRLDDTLESISDHEQMRVHVGALDPDLAKQSRTRFRGAKARERIASAKTSVDVEREEVFRVVGSVRGLSHQPYSIAMLKRESKQSLNVPCTKEAWELAKKNYGEGSPVLLWLECAAMRHPDGHREILGTTSARIVGGPPLTPRLEELVVLQDGWHEAYDDSKGPSPTLLGRVRRCCWQWVEHFGIGRPYLFAGLDGSVEIVWQVKNRGGRTTIHFPPRSIEVNVRVTRRGTETVRFDGMLPNDPVLLESMTPYMQVHCCLS